MGYNRRRRTSYRPKTRTYKKKRRAPLRKKVARLSKRVSKVTRVMNSTTATKIYRERFTTSIVNDTVNETVFQAIALGDHTLMQRALTKLKYYDFSAAPPVLTEVDGNSGTFQRSYLFKSKYKLSVRNNCSVPCWVSVWMCLPKEETSLSPAETWISGNADIGGATLNTAVMGSPYDSTIFKYAWRVIQKKKMLLNSGQEFSCYYRTSYTYDPSIDDTFNKEFYPKWCGLAALVHLEGVISHADSITTDIGSGKASIDTFAEVQHTVTYDGGYSGVFVEVLNSSDALPEPVTAVRYTNGIVARNCNLFPAIPLLVTETA